ncbi:MAG: phosphoribosyltransferase domain-containing protein, partial [Muribaculaceae bacterium]|nr:phosphoribosyltransferase domain-containing protein [Muribaculaceae bacterium]
VIIPARCQNILIVDDAIDTGKTLLSILNELNNVNFKTAVLTVTIDNPKVTPHYNLFKNVILRFPWARDAK